MAAGQGPRAVGRLRAGRRARRTCRWSTRSSSTTPARAPRPSGAAHATVVDHLVPPMARAETYGDMAKLEQLLDEYATVSGAGPGRRCRRAGADLDADPGRAAAPRPARRTSSRTTTSSTSSSCTSTAICARSRTCRSATGCTSSAARRPARRGSTSCSPCCAPRQVWGGRTRCAAGSAGRAGRARSAWTRRSCSPSPGAAGGASADLADAGGSARRVSGADGVDLLEAVARRLVVGHGDAELGRRDGPGRRAPRCSARSSAAGRGVLDVRLPTRSCRGSPGPPTRSTNVLRALDGGYVAGRAVRLADPRPGQRAADRPQLLLRRPEGDPVPQRLGRRRRAGRLAAGPAPGRHRRVPAIGRPDRLGHVGHAHPGRRHRRGAGAARLPPGLGRGVAPGHRLRGRRRWRSSAGRGST